MKQIVVFGFGVLFVVVAAGLASNVRNCLGKLIEHSMHHTPPSARELRRRSPEQILRQRLQIMRISAAATAVGALFLLVRTEWSSF